MDLSKKVFLITVIVSIAILLIAVQLTLNLFNIGNKKDFELVDVSQPHSIFQIIVHKDDLTYQIGKGITSHNVTIRLDDDFKEKYSEVKYSGGQKTVVVYPTFTETAYSNNGFYDYYSGDCNVNCLTVSIKSGFNGGYGASDTGYQVLKLLNYTIITDIDVDNDPKLLDNYDKVILLHNEYVTKEMFDAITNHPKVIYLYPNALYAEVKSDYEKNTITLIRGHGFPDKTIDNGFGWEYDNTRPYEFDIYCNNWEFYEIPNGKMLNCYPENFITESWELLRTIKEI